MPGTVLNTLHSLTHFPKMVLGVGYNFVPMLQRSMLSLERLIRLSRITRLLGKLAVFLANMLAGFLSQGPCCPAVPGCYREWYLPSYLSIFPFGVLIPWAKKIFSFICSPQFYQIY